jgi:hypothetical protein
MSESGTLEPSDEVDERHLELAREAGDAYLAAADHMIETVAHTGARCEVGEYVVGFAQEEAEGMYHLDGGELAWREPDDENCHLEVVVASAADGRFLPQLDVRATLTDDDGTEIGPTEIPFVWHPGLYHYGKNLTLPGDGTYDVAIHVDPAAFPRHDETNGERFDDPIDEVFEDVEIATGQA